MNIYKVLKTNKLISICLFICLLLGINYEVSYGESFYNEDTNLSFEVLNRDSGLSNLSISSIIQDKYGFIWFGSQGGLNYYDGREVVVIRNNPFDSSRLVHNLIQTMYYDEVNHEIWIGTYQGISRYLIGQNKFINYTVEEDGLSNPVVIAIIKDDAGQIWAGTMDGLNKIDPLSGDIKIYGVEEKVVRDIKIDSSGRMLIGSYAGLLYFDKENDLVKNTGLELPTNSVMTIDEFELGTISLGVWGSGLIETDLEFKSKNIKEFKDNRIYSVIQTSDGTKWIGTWGGGLFSIYKNGKESYYSGEGGKHSLVHPVVYSMLEDDTGILWIGTNGGGVCKVNPRERNYVKFSHDPENPLSLSQGKVINIFEDSDGINWFSIYNNGLNYYNPSEDKLGKLINDVNDSNSLPNNQVTDMIEIEDKKLLMASANGIYVYDMKTKKFSSMNILPDETLVYALEKGEGGDLWIGSYRNGVYLYNFDTKKLKQYGNSKENINKISDNLIYDILYDSKGRVWIATNNGLNLLKKGDKEFEVYMKKENDYRQISSNTIRTLFEDSKGRIWIGTVGGGLVLYNEIDDSFKSYTEIDGLSSNVIMGILEDDNGRIWASTENGISILDPSTESIFELTPDDGIGGWEFNAGYSKDSYGNMIFGGVHGITIIPGVFEEMNVDIPKAYITDVSIFQKSIDEDKLFFNDEILEFAAKESHIGFKVVALDYDSPQKINFLYKLEGFDKAWINNGNRDYFSYSLLPPGEYELKILAQTARNVSSNIVSLKIIILRPWYKQKIAYGAYLIITIIIIMMVVKIREATIINRKNSELSILNDKLKVANIDLENLSTKDSLTGLFNRRYFDIILEERISLAIRSNNYIALLMIDVDDFKNINDTYGHVAGDYFLKDISNAISSVLPRSTDFAARYGGDEFGVVLYDTNLEGAIIVAKEIEKAVLKVSIRKEYGIQKSITTISIGLVSIIPDKETSSNTIIELADRELYKSKTKGKNCISYM